MSKNIRKEKVLITLIILLFTFFILSGTAFAGSTELDPENYVLRAWRDVDEPTNTFDASWSTLNYRAVGYYEGTWEDSPRTSSLKY